MSQQHYKITVEITMYWNENVTLIMWFDVITGLKECEGGVDCLGTEGVLRVSLGCFVSFF